MTISRRTFLKGCAGLAGALMVPKWVFAQEQSLDGMLPIEIDTPGRYVLNSNQTLSLWDTPAILVKCDNVEIDLQGFQLQNTYGAATRSMGITAKNRNQIQVLNGEIKGFYAAVFLSDSIGATHGHSIKTITASGCTAIGFMISGNGCTIAQNTITNPGGSTIYAPTMACTLSMGIAIVRSLGSKVIGNNLSFSDAGNSDATVGIYMNDLAENIIILDNVVAGADHGIIYGAGATGEYRDNTVSAPYLLQYAGGRDIGHNL